MGIIFSLDDIEMTYMSIDSNINNINYNINMKTYLLEKIESNRNKCKELYGELKTDLIYLPLKESLDAYDHNMKTYDRLVNTSDYGLKCNLKCLIKYRSLSTLCFYYGHSKIEEYITKCEEYLSFLGENQRINTTRIGNYQSIPAEIHHDDLIES
jgi:hypothetical protein